MKRISLDGIWQLRGRDQKGIDTTEIALDAKVPGLAQLIVQVDDHAGNFLACHGTPEGGGAVQCALGQAQRHVNQHIISQQQKPQGRERDLQP